MEKIPLSFVIITTAYAGFINRTLEVSKDSTKVPLQKI